MHLQATCESISTKTAGEIQNEIVKKDFGSYTAYDMGYAICDQIEKEVHTCIQNHIGKFKDDEFCVVVQYATDPLLYSVVRRKFFAIPWLPDPRPMQSTWLYTHGTNSLKFLWALPDPMTMAELSEATSVPKEYERMKAWCDWWYGKCFWAKIRKQHGISMLSEFEIFRRNREKKAKPMDKNTPKLHSNPFYLPEVRIKKLEAKANTGGSKPLHQNLREAN